VGASPGAFGLFILRKRWRLCLVVLTLHSEVRGFLQLLILLRVARDMPQALSEVGWFTIALFGFGALAVTRFILYGATGLLGLKLDKHGFIVKSLKRNIRHDWADVGDFDFLKVPNTVRRWPLSRRCVMFNDYRSPESPIKWLRLNGRNRVLVESYEYPAEVLATVMSIWRERALRDRLSRDR
jgi:hypothetical protein